MIRSCFSIPNSNTSSSQTQQNLITCTYQTQLICNSPTFLTLTWSKTLSSHSLTIYATNAFSITISLYPSTFFVRIRPGSKSISLTHQRIKLHWDFTRAEYTQNSAEPESSFYIAISCNGKLEFFLGDLYNELIQRVGVLNLAESTLLSRREHVFGHKSYVSRVKLLGSTHEIGIECSNGGVLKVKIDGEVRLKVKRLAWKFRGNERILVGGTEVDFYWDVFNWVNNNNNCESHDDGRSCSHGIFIFQVGDGGLLPEIIGPEKKFMKKSLSPLSSATMSPSISLSPLSSSCNSVLQWQEESSDGGRSSCSSSTTRSCGSGGGFSLLLYAWMKD